MKLPWLFIGVRLTDQFGNLNEPVRVISRTSSSTAGTFMPVYSVRQFGNNCSSGPDSSTAPDSECAPTAEPFSRTQTLRSALSCFSRIAHARPAGPAPTITTSYSITSRSVMASLLFDTATRASCHSRCGARGKGVTFPRALAACGGGHVLVPGVARVEFHGRGRLLRRHADRAVEADAF